MFIEISGPGSSENMNIRRIRFYLQILSGFISKFSPETGEFGPDTIFY